MPMDALDLVSRPSPGLQKSCHNYGLVRQQMPSWNSEPHLFRRLARSLSSRQRPATVLAPAFPRSMRKPQTGLVPPSCRVPSGQ
jgi:hypothetical protein